MESYVLNGFGNDDNVIDINTIEDVIHACDENYADVLSAEERQEACKQWEVLKK